MSSERQFQSVHLEGQPRRELFRQARSKLSASCGQHTIAGDLRELLAEPGGPEAPTRGFMPNPKAVFFLKDGETLHRLAVGVNSVGRLPDNQVVLADDHVSRRHCAVVVHSDGRCELHDVASKNGTLLNGKKIAAPTPIAVGDQISLCGKMLELVEGM